MVSDIIDNVTHGNQGWRRRTLYLTITVLVLLLAPAVIILLANLTGVIWFSELYGPLVWWNKLSGTGFLVSFCAIIVLTGLALWFLLGALETTEGGW